MVSLHYFHLKQLKVKLIREWTLRADPVLAPVQWGSSPKRVNVIIARPNLQTAAATTYTYPREGVCLCSNTELRYNVVMLYNSKLSAEIRSSPRPPKKFWDAFFWGGCFHSTYHGDLLRRHQAVLNYWMTT